MAIDVTQKALIQHVGSLATRTVSALATTFKSAKVEGRTVFFYTSDTPTGTPAFSFNFPEDFFLEDVTLAENFIWDAESFPDSVNPNLDGKTVVIFKVKSSNDTVKFVFSDFTRLEEPYWTLDGTTAFYKGYFNPTPIITVKGLTTIANITMDGNNVTLQTADFVDKRAIVDGAGYNFYAYGGDVTYTLTAVSNNTTLRAGSAKTLINRGHGGAIIQTANNTLYAKNSGDYAQITGNAAANIITLAGDCTGCTYNGGAGNDTVFCSAGDNTLYGGGGSNVFVYGGGNDFFPDFTANDSIKFLGNTTAEKVTLTGGTLLATLNFGGVLINDAVKIPNAADTYIKLGDNFYYNDLVYDSSKTAVKMAAGHGTTLNAGEYPTNITKFDATDKTVAHVTANTLSNTITGSAGNDTIYGEAGNDYIDAGAGNNYVYGGNDNDTLAAHGGENWFYGGSGADVFIWDNNIIHVQDWEESDRVSLPAGAYVRSASLNAADNRLYVTIIGANGTQYNNGVQVFDANDKWVRIGDNYIRNNVIYNLDKNIASIGAGASTTITAADLPNAVTIDGTAKTLNITANTGANVIKGGVGSDTIYGNAGSNTIHGGGGADSVIGGSGSEIIYGDEGNDTLTGGAGTDTLYGGKGADVFVWTGGIDYIEDYDGDEIISLPAGAYVYKNSLSSFRDTQYISVNYNGTNYSDCIGVRNARDKWIRGSNFYVFNDLFFNSAKTAVTVQAGHIDTLQAAELPASVVTIDATAKGMFIFGNTASNSIKAGNSPTTLYGGAGSNTLCGGTATDLFICGSGNDTIQNYAEAEQISIVGGLEVIKTSINSDDFYATLSAAGNNSTSYYKYLKVVGAADKYVHLGENYYYQNNIYSAGKGYVTLTSAQRFDATSTTRNVTGSSSSDSIYGTNAASNNISGGAGNDYIEGNASSNILKGDEGNDTIKTGGYTSGKIRDTLYGGEGIDTFVWRCEYNSDTNLYTYMYCQIMDYEDNELISIPAGAVVYNLGSGADTIGGAYTSLYFRYNGRNFDGAMNVYGNYDFIKVGNGSSTVYCRDYILYNYDKTAATIAANHSSIISAAELPASVVTIDGSAKSGIVIEGNARHNYVIVGSGSNVLYGGAGNDTLEGGTGSNTLYGGGDNDVFVYSGGNAYIFDYENYESISLASGLSVADTSLNSAGAMLVTVSNGTSNTNNAITVYNAKGKVVRIAGRDYNYTAS